MARTSSDCRGRKTYDGKNGYNDERIIMCEKWKRQSFFPSTNGKRKAKEKDDAFALVFSSFPERQLTKELTLPPILNH